HALEAYFSNLFTEYKDTFEELGINANNGLETLLDKLQELPGAKRQEIEQAVANRIANGPDLAMVNSDKGFTNLHVPTDVIIDA
ncbi:NADP-dependent isocitrate dehydrogenase, partial [Maribacter flavus]|uniref:NADP-dependent isocitrate dehydrogenase n=1 Tax=Maribacter flavus TaxID=1658664 RepID=UPI003D33D61E